MKLHGLNIRILLGLSSLLIIFSAIPAHGQAGARLKLESLDHLATRSSETTMKEEQAQDGKSMVYVRGFEFKEQGAYKDSDLDAIRAQLRAPGWTQFMKVVDKDDPAGEETVEIYVFSKLEKKALDGGMVIIVREPKELVVVNIVGQGDMDKLMSQVKQNKSPK